MNQNGRINRREFVKTGAATGAFLAAAGRAAARLVEPEKRPSLVFVFSDRQPS